MTPSPPLTTDPPQPAELALLAEVLRTVARTRRLRPDEADDYIQSAHLRLIERNYDVFRQFAGRSSLKTYLTVVAVRLLLDWRNSHFGKWRPSGKAQRLGVLAVTLERYVSRDGLTPAEAVASVSLETGLPTSALESLCQCLPPRPRRRREPESAIDAERHYDFVDPIEHNEQRAHRRRLRLVLQVAVARLPREDRLLLGHRFEAQRTIQSASVTLKADPKQLYRRLDRVLRQLRSELRAAGFNSRAVAL